MRLYERMLDKEEELAVVGLGYVGLPLAVEFSNHFKVIGFDTNSEKINLYKRGYDPTKDVGDDKLKNASVNFTFDEEELKRAKFYVVAVPTPINEDNTPNLTPVEEATRTVARNLTKGDIVVYESTVYPGTTEEVCVPILEKISGLKYGSDFKVGYSPERVSPGDNTKKVTEIVKIVSGCDEETLDEVSKVYRSIIKAGIYEAESIKVAEAAKVIENSQRDINIAFMNELSIIFNDMNIDTNAVLNAAKTKWNFVDFKPGLVGGHCIGVDPYYLIYKAQEVGYDSQIIASGRKVNEEMSKYVALEVVKQLISLGKVVKGARVALLGITFKEDCPDVRNTKIVDIINYLKGYGINVFVYDPVADRNETYKSYNIELVDYDEINNVDAIVVAVAHDEFKNISLDELEKKYVDDRKTLVDLKGIYNKKDVEDRGITYWRL
ncbi:nucleotide sugar dehydrogenase [uncultured Clostridium sp.]|uniref:nucleotide sugar dehydrogenase n=1 Tax=uncultured Clostridium sp. TaxID=59620 RepID=UPI0025EC5219|nr:nucleotide sugar dehydrogenase [uncultured Clostridium sp.]